MICNQLSLIISFAVDIMAIGVAVKPVQFVKWMAFLGIVFTRDTSACVIPEAGGHSVRQNMV